MIFFFFSWSVSDMLCFWHILTMFSKVFLSLYRVFLVLSSHYRSGVALGRRWTTWSKRGRKHCNLVIFTQNRLKWLFPIARNTPSACSSGRKETITYFGICSNLPIFLFQPHVALTYLLFLFLFIFYASFLERNNSRAFSDLWFDIL